LRGFVRGCFLVSLAGLVLDTATEFSSVRTPEIVIHTEWPAPSENGPEGTIPAPVSRTARFGNFCGPAESQEFVHLTWDV
jgi:hypothetical protein